MRASWLLPVVCLLGAAGIAVAAPRSLVPDDWRELESRREGGERIFVSPGGEARLSVGHIVARRGERSRELDRLSYRDGETITYRRRGGTWLAVSGYRGDKIFYRKSNLACGGTRWHTVEFEYPREAKRQLDRTVTAVARGMGAYSSDC